MKIVSGQWYDVPGMGGVYQITPEGLVRRTIYPRKGILTPILKRPPKGSCYNSVRITDSQGVRHDIKVTKLMQMTFMRKKTRSESIVHRNGNTTDDRLENLTIVSNQKMGEMTGHKATRKPVARISKDGEIIETFASARQAARSIGCISYQTIMDRCNKKIVRDEFALDGTTYRWYVDDLAVEKFCRMLREAAVRKVGIPIPAEEWDW